jgi:hypothetical protein
MGNCSSSSLQDKSARQFTLVSEMDTGIPFYFSYNLLVRRYVILVALALSGAAFNRYVLFVS